MLEGPLVMCFKEFSKLDGMPRFKSKIIKQPSKFEKPFCSLFWAAGFSFSQGTLLHDCPYSLPFPDLDLFFGEELYQMLLYFTHGYHLYSPSKTIAYHLWDRQYRATYKEDHKNDE